MKRAIFIAAIILSVIFRHDLTAQTVFIDSSLWREDWPVLGDVQVSNNGRYVMYYVLRPAEGSRSLFFKSIQRGWAQEIPNAEGILPGSSEFGLYKSNDSIYCIYFAERKTYFLAEAEAFKISNNENDEWVACLSRRRQRLVICNLTSRVKYEFADVADYYFNSQGDYLVIHQHSATGEATLKRVDVATGIAKCFWQGFNFSSLVFADSGDSFAFVGTASAYDASNKIIYVYNTKNKAAKPVFSDSILNVGSNLKIEHIVAVTAGCQKIFFRVSKSEQLPEKLKNSAAVNLWSYTDQKLQSQQLKQSTASRQYLSVLITKSQRFIRIEEENDVADFRMNSLNPRNHGEFIIVDKENGDGDISEGSWNAASHVKTYLASTVTSTRQFIRDNKDRTHYQVSPAGKFILFVDKKVNDLFAYSTDRGIAQNVTSRIARSQSYNDNSYKYASSCPKFAAWMEGDSAALVYLENDIWMIDLNARSAPVNITRAFGSQHGVVFRLALDEYEKRPLKERESIVLSAFNLKDKTNGFFRVRLDGGENPVKLTMGAYLFNIDIDLTSFYSSFRAVKARDRQVYVVKRESAYESPNYYCTTDFRTFTNLTGIAPEKKYFWHTSELHSWTDPDGTERQGILFKPHNFDPLKKYPVIFHYYETFSDQLNRFQTPGLTGDHLNIPFFVSLGYLVFAPDIHYQTGLTGRSALNAVTSAAGYLKSKSWVDYDHMGIQGHSFGGFETNYIVTHSNVFKAAVSGSGASDCVSHYNSVMQEGNGMNLQILYEESQSRLGTTLWDRPDLFIKNSPIFFADKVTTPLLMMNNRLDAIVPFSQGVEFFNALRRLNKKVWMLDYYDEAHVLVEERNRIDYTMRITQFFDHYLKGAPAPKWMTRGIPAKIKGRDNGFELDYEIKTPGEGLLTEEEKKKVDVLQHRKPITITIE